MIFKNFTRHVKECCVFPHSITKERDKSIFKTNTIFNTPMLMKHSKHFPFLDVHQAHESETT